MAGTKSSKNPDTIRARKPNANVETKSKGRKTLRGKLDSDLHYVLISKDGTLSVVSRTTGKSKTIDPKLKEFKGFADVVADRQKLGMKLGQMLVERGFNGGSFENCLFIESFK